MSGIQLERTFRRLIKVRASSYLKKTAIFNGPQYTRARQESPLLTVNARHTYSETYQCGLTLECASIQMRHPLRKITPLLCALCSCNYLRFNLLPLCEHIQRRYCARNDLGFISF